MLRNKPWFLIWVQRICSLSQRNGGESRRPFANESFVVRSRTRMRSSVDFLNMICGLFCRSGEQELMA